MNKIFTLLLTGALFGFTASDAWAKYWRYESDAAVKAEDIQPNTAYAFQSGFAATSSAAWFLNGDNFRLSNNLLDTQIYEFVPVENTKDGKDNQVYYLKRHGLNEYVADPVNNQLYTNQLDRAWKVVVLDTEHQDLSDNYVYNWVHKNDQGEEVTEDLKGWDAWLQQAKDANSPEQAHLQTLTSNAFAENGSALVIVAYEPKNKEDQYSEYNFLLTHYSDDFTDAPARGTDYNRNAWVIYPASVMPAREALDGAVQEVLGGATSIPEKLKNFTRGTGAGEYSAEIYAQLEKTWEQVAKVQNNELQLSDEAIEKLAADLEAQYKAFVNSGKPLTEGYYILYSLRPDTDAFPNNPNVYPYGPNDSGYDGGVLYDGITISEANKGLRWTLKKGDLVDFEFEEFNKDRTNWKNGKFVWKVTKSKEKDKEGNPLFYFQNVMTGSYIGNVGAAYQPITMTKDPEVPYTIATSMEFPGYFNFYSPTLPVYTQSGATTKATYSGLHTERGANNVVAWDSRVGGSCWKVVTVTQEEVEAMLRNAEVPKRKQAMANLIKQAEEAMEAGRNYMGVNDAGQKIEQSLTGEISPVDGLVTTVEQIASPMKETSEGEFAHLFDADPMTYFHTSWQGGENAWLGGHYLQMTLSKEESKLFVKWTKRIKSNKTQVNDGGAPLKVKFWGTNDDANLEIARVDTENPDGTVKKGFDAWKEKWDSLTVSTFKYPYEVTVETNKIAHAAGGVYAEFAKAYKHIRMEVLTRVVDSDKSQGNVFFHGSELRVYKGAYDPDNSLIQSVPVTIVKALQDQVAAAKALQAKDDATDAQINALKKAYDEFLKNYPDPERLKTAITTAKAAATAAVEGTALGYYKEGAKAAYEAVITEVEAGLAAAGKLPTAQQVLDLMAKLDAAKATFDAALLVPTSGYYIIESAASGAVNNKRKLYAYSSARSENNKTEGYVMGGGRQKKAATNEYEDNPEFESNLAQFWEVTKKDTGLVIRNVFTGLYLAPVAKVEKVTLSEQPYVLPYRFKEAGCFNFLIAKDKAANGTYVYVNLQPSTGNLVTWNAADGRDNSAFSFIPVEATKINEYIQTGFNYELRTPGKMEIITLPIDAKHQGGFYSVIGQNPADNRIQLKEADEILKAGQAYVFVPKQGEAPKVVQLYSTDATVATLKPIWTVLPAVNGLQGTFGYDDVPVASGLFDNNGTKVLLSEAGDVAQPNSGYFTRMPETSEKGALEIAANGIVTKIDNLWAAPAAQQQGIYNLQGVRFSSAKRLPAGVYVIHGKKVVVQ